MPNAGSKEVSQIKRTANAQPFTPWPWMRWNKPTVTSMTLPDGFSVAVWSSSFTHAPGVAWAPVFVAQAWLFQAENLRRYLPGQSCKRNSRKSVAKRFPW
jgi:hypothetical protein